MLWGKSCKGRTWNGKASMSSVGRDAWWWEKMVDGFIGILTTWWRRHRDRRSLTKSKFFERKGPLTADGSSMDKSVFDFSKETEGGDQRLSHECRVARTVCRGWPPPTAPTPLRRTPPSSNSNHLPNVPLPNSMTLWGRDPDIETIAGSVCWRRSLSKRIKKTRGAREDRSLGIEKLLWKSLISDLPFFLSVICPWDPVSMSPVLLVVVLFSFWWKSKWSSKPLCKIQ